jgi:hypothetical protein
MKPEDFPIGSMGSRAAVRLRLVRRNDSLKRVRLISHVPSGYRDNSRYHFGGWQEWGGDRICQLVYVPIAWVKPGELIPTCPDCGTPFKKTLKYTNLTCYEADCMDKHDPEPLGQMTYQHV